MNVKIGQNYYLFIPVLLALFLALIVTLSSDWPLSWDIYAHISYALTYVNNGITAIDPLLNAPEGKAIGYPPLFHIVLIIVSSLSTLNFIDTARLLQVLLSVFNVATIVFIASKFHDKTTGFMAGLLILSSFMFSRFLLPIPETWAMIFFSLAVYFYYKSTVESKFNYALLTALFSLLVLAAHFSSFVYLGVLLTIMMVAQTLILRNSDAVVYYLGAFVPVLLVGIVAMVFMFMFSPSHLTQILGGAVGLANNPFDLFMGQSAMGLERYVRCVGILPLVFAGIGLYYSFKNKECLFVTAWALVAFFFTNAHWFGVPVYTFRMLIYLMVPLVILGGYALSKIISILKTSNKQLALILIVTMIILSFGFGFVNINDSSVKYSNAQTEKSTFQIAPPTSDEVEVIKWFESQNTTNKSILTNNLFFGTMISSVDKIPLHYSFDIYTNQSLTKSSVSSLNNQSIGYIVYDKNLTLNDSDKYGKPEVIFVNGSYYPSYYFSKEITDKNFAEIKLKGTEKVFENNRFIICKVD